MSESAKASTTTPQNLVTVMPENTDEPMSTSATRTRCSREPVPRTNAVAMCTWNSTAMPMHMTMFTTDTALRLMPHQFITASSSTSTMTVEDAIRNESHGSHRSSSVTRKTPPTARLTSSSATFWIVRYW